MNKLEFKKDLLKCFKKIQVDKNKNIFITSNLIQMSKVRIKKFDKLDLILKTLISTIGENYSIFTPTATLNLCNTKFPFDVKRTPSHQMGPLSEYIRNKGSVRSLHPFWSVSGLGKNAKILENVSRHAYGYGSPWSKMLDLDFLQVNIGIHPSKAVTLVHHIETIIGVPYRYNKLFRHPILYKDKVYMHDFFMGVFFKKVNYKKKFKLNEHFFEVLKKNNKLNYTKNKYGLEMWSFKMKDFFDVATEMFQKNIFVYLENKPDFDKIINY